MPPRDALHDLRLLIRSRYGAVHVETREEDRARTLLHHLADQLSLPLFGWSRLRGLARVDLEGPVYDTAEARSALSHVTSAGQPALYHFPLLDGDLPGSPELIAQLEDAARAMEGVDGAVILTGADLELPAHLRPRIARVVLPGPGPEEFRRLLSRILRDYARKRPLEVDLSEAEKATLVNHLTGLTLLEAEKVLTRAIVEDDRLTADDIGHVIEAKRRIVEEEGLLEYYPLETAGAEVADLHRLRSWLEKRKAVVLDPERAREFGLAFPRGILLLGVPGCGKSLSAKAVAAEWRLPLLKLDPSNLYNKYVGQSERNFQRAMRTAEKMSPLVLWIDELEKAFASGGSEDGGVSQRILGSFLSWMQERRGDVFIVATANEVGRLPPELLRKGRFDEIFFVDLPETSTRKEIFRIHLRSRGQEPEEFDLDMLADATEGFSGAEIEGVVVSGLYTAFSGSGVLSDELLRREVGRTRPLSVTRKEEVEALRGWARERTVPAN